MINKYFSFYLIAIFGIAVGCKAPQQIVAKPANAAQQLEDSLFGGHLGILVMEAESGKILAEHNSHKYFVPASNTKLVSMYAGLKYLGDSLVGLRFYDAGDTIYAQPTGDPTILASDYKMHPVLNWMANINKPIVMDASKWRAERYGRGWTWSDYQASYQQERSALPVYGNMMPLMFTAKGDSTYYGGAKRWETTPKLTLGEHTKEQVWQVQPESLSYIYMPQLRFNTISRNYAANGYEVKYNGRDTVFETEIPMVTHGIKTAVEILRARLNKNETDIIIRNSASAQPQTSNLKQQTLKSQPLDSMLKPMMYRSDNFYAEQTLMMASTEFLGYMSDRAIIDTLLKSEFKDMPDKPVWVDGSGLSRYNLFSPADFVWLLNKMRNEFEMERIKAILPTGNAGTLKNYYKSLNGKIFAKTGTLSGVVGLSGYLYAKSGKLLLFSALVNNHNMEGPAVRRLVERYLLGVWEAN